VAQANALSEGQSGDGAAHAAPGGADAQDEEKAAAQSAEAALLRAQHTQPTLAERHLHVSAGGPERLPDRFRRRLFALRGGVGPVPEPDGRARAGGVPDGGIGVWRAQGDADRPGAPVRQLAGEDAVSAGVDEGPRASPDEPAPPSDDLGESGAFLEDDLGGISRPGAVWELRGGAGAGQVLAPVLQPQTAAPGDRRVMPGGPVFRDSEGIAPGDRGGDQGKRAGAGVEPRAQGAVLHGGADGRPVGGAARGKGSVSDAGRRRGAGRRPGGQEGSPLQHRRKER